MEQICERIRDSSSILSFHMSDLQLYSYRNRALMLRLKSIFNFEFNPRFEQPKAEAYLGQYEQNLPNSSKFLAFGDEIKTICAELLKENADLSTTNMIKEQLRETF